MCPSVSTGSQSAGGCRAVLFDLFGTIVLFVPQVPAVEVAGSRWRSTMRWLQEAAEREAPGVAIEDLLTALMQVTEELVRRRPPEYREVPSRERFRRALVRIGFDDHRAPDLAERLSLAHMTHLASMTVLPEGHAAVLRELGSRYGLGLVSNFDHAPTARRVLANHGIAGFFDVIVISDEFGRRKPHPAIFEAALHGMGARADQALFVGDSVSDDVIGAHNAQLAMVWLNANGEPLPPGTPAPQHVITQLGDLLPLLP
jgi:HAD superfamily hydrolase (TIGR01549 family)